VTKDAPIESYEAIKETKAGVPVDLAETEEPVKRLRQPKRRLKELSLLRMLNLILMRKSARHLKNM